MPPIARSVAPVRRMAPLVREAVEPFRTVEQAWFWTMAALRARHEGASRSGGGMVRRPCEPDDIIKCLDQVFRARGIDAAHARVLRIWGERQVGPDASRAAENGAAVLWEEAMERLGWVLRVKGIVA